MDQDQTPSELRFPPAGPEEDGRQKSLIAPLVHTAVLVVVLLANSLLSTRLAHLSGPVNKSMLYLRTIAWEWAALLYVWLGTRRRLSWRQLVGGRWSSVELIATDVLLGIAMWLVIMTALAVLATALGMFQGSAAQTLHEAQRRLGFLVPQTRIEVLIFLCLSATAGFCEEIIFRGYLLRQFTALSGKVWLAVLLQALLFGAAHGYEGGRRMALIAAEGVLLGALAIGRRSLRPGMVAHATQDAISGLLARHLH